MSGVGGVSGAQRFERLLRWYPPSWRARYGDEMTALLEDTHGMSRVPFAERAALARSGTVELARAAGLLGNAATPNERMRAGSLLILCAWALFMVGGSMFAKFTDNWMTATPKGQRGLPSDALTAVQVAIGAGLVIVLAAALLALPAFLKLVRDEGWDLIIRRVTPAVATGLTAAALAVGTVVWAHSLSPHDRNGGLVAYEALFVISGLAIVAAIATGTGAAVSLARRLDLPRRTLRLLGRLALALAAAMVVIISGTITWWAALATYAPGFLRSGIGSRIIGTSSTVPPTLVVAGALMLVGLVLAALGTDRVIGSRAAPVAP